LAIVEIFVGRFFVGFFPMRIKLVVVLIGTAIAGIILGDLWGFYYL